MSESIVETILPGTYIEVRAEGLLTVGAIATGNIGIFGTAEKGNGEIETLSSFDEGKAKFGESGIWDSSTPEINLSLVRSLKFLFDNGARTVYAKRVYDETSATASTYQIKSGNNSLELKAKTPGTWANRLQVRVEEGEAKEKISNERIATGNGPLKLSAQKIHQPESAENSVGDVIVRESGLVKKFQLKLATSSQPASSQVVKVDSSSRVLTFAANMSPSASSSVHVNYWVPKDVLRKITLQYSNVQETYLVPSIKYLNQLLNDERNPSRLVEAVNINGSGLPDTTQGFETFSGGVNGMVSSDDYNNALEGFVDQNVQIILAAGLNFSNIKASMLGHLEKTENLGRERIAVVGADNSSSDVDKVLENASEVADKRLILVAPGLKQKDSETGKILKIPPCYSAAAVAGRLSSVSPHISLTNKSLNGIEALADEYNYGQLTSLVQNRVLALQKKRGIRVVKAISTHDEAFKQISIRRIVDYIKEGTRQGSNQYIGKLNNPRVRSALHTTLNSFLTDMLTREFLTNYKLEVFADRAMEIRGEVLVTMDLMPTFSIDVIRVIMNLS